MDEDELRAEMASQPDTPDEMTFARWAKAFGKPIRQVRAMFEAVRREQPDADTDPFGDF